MDIYALKQQVIEDTYSETNNKKRVLQSINSLDELVDLIDQAENRIIDWLNTEAKYKSLNEIKRLIEVDDVKDTIYAMLVCVFMDGTDKTIQQVVGAGLGSLRKSLSNPFDAAKAAAEMLGIICELDLVDITPAKEGRTEYTMVSSQYSLDEETIEKIHATKFMPPMLVRPKHVYKNRDSAYLTFKQSMILGDAEAFHEEKISLDVVNIQNSIPLELDSFVLNLPETSNKPLDTTEKIKNFNRMVNASKTVYDLITENGNVFFNTHGYDMRGRLYSRGYYVHIQSTEYKKCLINFQYKEKITGVL